MVKDTFVEMALNQNADSRPVVDLILEDAPIFATLPTMVSTDSTQNKYMQLTDVVGGNLRAINQAPTQASADFKMELVDLSIIDAEITIPMDTYSLAGGEQLFQRNERAVIKKTAQNVDETIFNMVRSFAINNGNYQSAGGSANTNYSIVCVNWEEGINYGLTSPNGAFSSGKMMAFRENPIYKDQTTGLWMKSKTFQTMLGLQLADPRKVSAITNIDLDNGKLPTVKQLTQMVIDARASAGGMNTVIYAHPDVVGVLGDEYKFSQLQLFNDSNIIDTTVEGWKKTPFLESYTIPAGTEANVA